MRCWEADGAAWAEHGDLRLRFASAADGRYRFTTLVRSPTLGWLSAAAGENLLVTCPDLAPESVRSLDGERLDLAGTGPEPGAAWQGSVTAVGELLRLEVRLRLPQPLPGRPELLLWLGHLSVIDDRQRLTWRRTLLAGPTVNGQGLSGNDLPALYHWDPLRHVETVVAVDAAQMAWAPGRLLTYRCQEKWSYAEERYGVGLIAAGDPFTLAAGEHTFVWYLWQRQRSEPVDAWEGAGRLVHVLGPLLPAPTPYPGGGPTWADLAAGCRRGLARRDLCWTGYDGVAGLRAYVRGTSRYVADADARQGFELMAQLDVLPPLALYQRLHPSTEGEAMVADLLQALLRFRRPGTGLLPNDFPHRGTVADLWYPFENGLIKLGWVAAITGEPAHRELLAEGMAAATALARRWGYLFPLFADVAGGQPIGPCPNYGAGGLYAYAHAQAHTLLGGEVHRQEARAALSVLRRLPPDLVCHEPQQLAFAAAAAALLGEPGLAADFLHAQLRMAYWFADPAAGGAETRGMFQACASLLYPAFKENVEALLPWTLLLRHDVGDPALLLRIVALQLCGNRAFFRGEPCPCIPYENLGSAELPAAGSLGKEIYGAGEVFWLYLLSEGLEQTDDRAVLALCLDLLEPSALADFPASCREFVLYNTAAQRRRCTFAGTTHDLAPGEWRRVRRARQGRG